MSRPVLTLPLALPLLTLSLLTGCEPSPPAETEAERRAAIDAAFVAEEGAGETAAETVDPAVRAEIEAFLGKLGPLLKAGDGKGATALLSPGALLDAIDEQDLCKLPGGKEREGIEAAMVPVFEAKFATEGPLLGWHSAEIRRIDPLGDDRWVAYGRFRDDDFGVFTKDRYWIVREKNGLRFYDWESFDVAIRTSTLMGITIAGSVEKLDWVPLALSVSQGFSLLASLEGAFDSSDLVRDAQALIEVESAPPALHFIAHLALHLVSTFDEGGGATGREHIDAMIRLRPDSPLPYQSLGDLHFAREEYAEAIRAFEKSAEMIGWDCDLHESVSDCHYLSGNREKALEHAEKGVADYAESLGCLASLAVCLPAGRKAEVLPRIAALSNPTEGYVTVVDYAWAEDDVATVRAVLPAFREADPTCEYLANYGEELDAYIAPKEE